MVRFGVYLARKAGKALFLMVGVSLIVFAFYRHTGVGSAPWTTDKGLIEWFITRVGRIWDTSFFIGYFYYINYFIHGEWGISSSEGGRLVWDVIMARLPLTLGLSLVSFILTMCMGVPIGIYTVLKKGTRMGNVLEFVINLCSSSPVFFVALLLPYILYSLYSSWGLSHSPFPFYGPSSIINFILPVLTIALVGMGIVARYVRRATQQVLEEDYIKTGEMKGLPKMSVIVKHALRNILLFPQYALVSILSVLLVGIIFAETLFDLPGLGQFLVRSMLSWDMDAMFGLLLFFSFAFIIIGFSADILRYFLDPRLSKDAADVQKA